MPQSGFEDGFQLTTGGSLDAWVKEIFAKVPGTVEGYLYDQVKLVITDFFHRTKSWRAFLGPFTVDANDGQLLLNPVDSYSKVIMVLNVIRQGSRLSQITMGDVPQTFNTVVESNNPDRFYLQPYDVINLVPVPAKDVENIYVNVALTPRLRSDNRIPDWIVDQCYEAIKAGTLQRLYEEPGKVYSNVASAEYWAKRYRAEMARSRSVAIQNYGEMPQPWMYNKWNM